VHRFLFLLPIVALDLASDGAAQSPQPPRCSPKPIVGETRFDTSRVRDLAGEYDVVFVLTTGAAWGTSDHRGRLVLWVQDSVRSERGPLGRLPGGRKRILAGSFTVQPPDTSFWWRRMASADLDHPGAIWEWDRLRLGDHDVFDGTGENLTVTHYGPTGFRGRWEQDNGIAMMIDSATHQRVPDPAGYFCAHRLAPGR